MFKRLMIASLLLLPLCSAASPQLSQYPDLFVTDGSLKVTLVEETSGNQALLQITGTDQEIDGVVFRADKSSRGENATAYQIQLDGRARAPLVKSQQWGSDRFTLYMPNGDEYHLHRDKEESEAVDTEQLLSTYEEQKSQGVQEALAAFDRAGNKEVQQSRISGFDKTASKACGSDVATQVDWESVTDELLMDISISGYCGVVVSQMERLCSADEHFADKAGKIEHVQCSFQDELKLRSEGSTLNFTTERSEPNQQEFARQFLRNL